MKYLVIELEPQPKILCQRKHSDDECEPMIYETKQDAFRDADKCKKGLVYPITDIMKSFARIKEIMLKYDCETAEDHDLRHSILNELDEII